MAESIDKRLQPLRDAIDRGARLEDLAINRD